MRVAIGCDPNAQALKAQLIPFIEGLGHEVYDLGSDDPIYANVAINLGEAVARKEYDRGILICGTGIGVCITANKVPGVYAALVTDIYQAQRAVLSNNANIITLGAQIIGIELAKCLVKEYLSLTFDPNSRSAEKLARLMEYDKEKVNGR
ncbi:RpiB/LacA/LacB family sugar-phosphate isomerase [Lachnospiraceae bacterium MD1]|uniref:RpiB/LacA/LacB family sugar-phosphate isomerase n=1 Tax=Variimorphobacter saccharofermentans TaxID=2755051 RepID=A0A839K4U6_9FIRM|nr:RpiB/LacA/LacB family sugar-phosphate isomerase [Variimorphobacter saccharofermentans]MBB2184367.1 RpiB/LacA/LacB family sugar-phosphate isomerase [Variimorphobacter saccharofermentans]